MKGGETYFPRDTVFKVEPQPDGSKVRFASDPQTGEQLDATELSPKPLRIKAKVRRSRAH